MFWKAARVLPNIFLFFNVLDCQVDGSLGHTDGLGGKSGAAGVEAAHGRLEAVSGLAQHVGGGDAEVIEEDVVGVRAVHAHGLLGLAYGIAFGVLVALQDEGGDLLFGCVPGAGDCKEHDQVGVLGAGN